MNSLPKLPQLTWCSSPACPVDNSLLTWAYVEEQLTYSNALHTHELCVLVVESTMSGLADIRIEITSFPIYHDFLQTQEHNCMQYCSIP